MKTKPYQILDAIIEILLNTEAKLIGEKANLYASISVLFSDLNSHTDGSHEYEIEQVKELLFDYCFSEESKELDFIIDETRRVVSILNFSPERF